MITIIVIAVFIGVISLLVAALKKIQAKEKSRWEQDDRHIQMLIEKNLFPAFTVLEQVLFLAGLDRGQVLEKLGVQHLSQMHFNKVVTASKEEIICELASQGVFERLKLKSEEDGIWISKWEKEFEIVSQERGIATPFKAFTSKNEMLEYLADIYLEPIKRISKETKRSRD